MTTYNEILNVAQNLNNYFTIKQLDKRVDVEIVGANNSVKIIISTSKYSRLSEVITRNNKEALSHLWQLVVLSLE